MVTAAGVFFVRKIHVTETGQGDKKIVSIDTPMGHVTVHQNHHLDPESIGVPIYPGSVPSKKQEGADFQFDAGDLHRDWTVSAATYLTSDSPEKVESFYKEKFPSWNQKWANGNLHLDTRQNGQMRSISVTREGDQTRIGVASAGAPAGN